MEKMLSLYSKPHFSLLVYVFAVKGGLEGEYNTGCLFRILSQRRWHFAPEIWIL